MGCVYDNSLSVSSVIIFLGSIIASPAFVEGAGLEFDSVREQSSDGGRDSSLVGPGATSATSILDSVVNQSGDPSEPVQPPLTLPLPPNYDKLVLPSVNGSIVFVRVYLSLLQVTDVDEEKGLLELHTEFGFSWLDWRLWSHLLHDPQAKARFGQDGPSQMIFDSQILNSIWKPDVFIDELESVRTSYLLSRQIWLAVTVRNSPYVGTIDLNTRQALKIRCDMDFTFYPADTQKCKVKLLSYSYTEDELLLLWSPNQTVYLDEMEDPNYNFQVSHVEPGNFLYDLSTLYHPPCCKPENFSTLTFTIQVRRNLTYHLVQTCLPSIILILITWLCFLLPGDMVEARIGISMTTLLTIIAMFGAVRDQAPKVSYTMAIDVWMVFCVFIIFLALVLFTVLYWMRWKFVKKPAAAAPESAAAADPNYRKYNRIVTWTKRYAFVVFAVIFALFLLLFGVWLLTASGYYSWNPSPKYNAIDSSFGPARRTLTPVLTPYSDVHDRETVLANNSFHSILKSVICPTFNALNANTSSIECNGVTN